MKIQEQDTQRLYNDTHELQNIKGNPDKDAALQMASGEFESLFLQTVLKHMRQASDALQDEEDGFLNSRQQKFYREMFDGQLAVEMGQQQSLGIADMLVRQLGQKNEFKPEAEMVAMNNHSTRENQNAFTIDPIDAALSSCPTAANSRPHWMTGTAPLSQHMQFSRAATTDTLSLQGAELSAEKDDL
ncbi:rod-binding protein [Enterovibrio makurazakiensis]|uniref:rod-binding protein n=1 Tax=Enterovibrio makurazakiensis TaxID=2910232 RepID=UPI003D23EDB9